MTNTFTLHLGDCIETMRNMPDNSVDSVVTDPPYGIRFMGKAWDGADIEARVKKRRKAPSVDTSAGPKGGHNSIAAEAGKYNLAPEGMKAFQEFSEEWAREALRVLKPGGHLLSFSSPRTYHRMVSGIEDAGFEIRDQIMWVYGSGFPKSHNLKGEHEGWGTALKPAHEPIVMARKPLVGTVAANVLEHSTGAINIDGCRVPTEEGGRPLREVAPIRDDYSYNGNSLAGRVDGSLQSSKAVGSTEAGRWPANLIHDGSDEVVELFPANAGAAAPVKGTEASEVTNGIYGKFADRVPGTFHADKGSAARFFYCTKASKKDRNEGLDDMPDAILARSSQAQAEAKRGNTVTNEGGAFNKARIVKNNHPTVKPTELMSYLCRLVTPPGGTVLDPFMGSGSTGKAAIMEGLNFVGIDVTPEYVDIARARIEHARAIKAREEREKAERSIQNKLFS